MSPVSLSSAAHIAQHLTSAHKLMHVSEPTFLVLPCLALPCLVPHSIPIPSQCSIVARVDFGAFAVTTNDAIDLKPDLDFDRDCFGDLARLGLNSSLPSIVMVSTTR
jgi:hypothetical protein